ncbi:MAG: pepsin-like aspartyl protease [Candidatus Roizmanbacteria bacterium]
MSPETDSITITTKTYTSVVSYFTSTGAGLICNSTTVTGCYYNGLCSDIIGKLGNLWFSFTDGVKYVVPPQSYLAEDSNALVCRVKIAKTTGNTIVLGQPWFKTFYTAFDIANNQISFVPSVDTFGSTM